MKSYPALNNIESLYELEFKQGFVKAAVSRAVRLQECLLRALWMY